VKAFCPQPPASCRHAGDGQPTEAFVTIEDVRSTTPPSEAVLESESFLKRSWFNRSKRK